MVRIRYGHFGVCFIHITMYMLMWSYIIIDRIQIQQCIGKILLHEGSGFIP